MNCRQRLIYDTLNDGLRKINTILEQRVATMVQKQTDDFDELSISINGQFATHIDLSIQQNNRSMELLELSIDRMKVKQGNILHSFMMETNQTITSLKDTIAEGQKNARISQEVVTSKALEFEALTD